MSLSSLVSWWEEWQLRILVLGSLAIQLYIAVIAPFRKWTGLTRLNRLLIWVSYLGGDALAIYALATLFNRQKRLQHVTDASHDLEVLWAPILLMHLGGRMTISAYNIEDNELWLRHVGVAISQVTVTVYVFWTTWSPSADKRLFAAAIVLFILGIVRCFEKPLALKRASFNNLLNYFIPVPMKEITDDRELELERYIQDAKDCYVQSSRSTLEDGPEKESHMEKISVPNRLFVDYAYAYNDRIEKLKSLRLLDPESTFKALRGGLSRTFNLVYTKMWRFGNEKRALAPTPVDYLSVILWEITMTFPVASIVLFHISHKEAYRGSDIKVTYLLLYITYFAELISMPLRLAFSSFHGWSRSRPVSVFDWYRKLCNQASTMVMFLVLLPPFPFVKVEQHSLIGVLADKDKNKMFLASPIARCRLFKHCGCQDFLEQRWFGRSHLFLKGKDITSLVIAHAEDAWMNHIKDVESYWELSDSRGHLTLEHHNGTRTLWDSLEKPFDESVILWHLATDLCFHCRGTSADVEPASFCRVISNYMMYLLCANAEMLLPGTRTSLFKEACSQLDVDILQARGDDDKHLTLTEKVISKAAKSEKGFLHDSWMLAQGLMQHPGGGGGAAADDDDGKKMWKVIKGVWVEMLCFSACRCRAYLHAKNLAYGGEFLTYVALVMSNAGLETFADRQQRMKLRLPTEQRVAKVSRVTVEEEAVIRLGEENAAATPSSSASAPASSPAMEVVVIPSC